MQKEQRGERLQPFPEYTHVPEELQDYHQFVVWTYHEVAGRRTKPPYDAKSGRLASPTNPATWSSAMQALHALKTGNYEGIGFVFTPTDPFIGTDLDHCICQDETLQPRAQEIVAALNSYTEYSPSGTGLHILTQARLPEGGRRRENIEIYDRGRYFTLTGKHLTGTPHTIEQRQAEQMQVYQRLAPQERITPLPVFPHSQADAQVLEKARRARNGQDFTALYRGDIGGFRSKSEADFTLVLRLLYWCNDDVGQVRRLFERSGLYDEKTNTPRGDTDYLGEPSRTPCGNGSDTHNNLHSVTACSRQGNEACLPVFLCYNRRKYERLHGIFSCYLLVVCLEK